MTSNEIQKRALEMRRPPEAAFLMVAEEKDEVMRFGNFRGGNLVQNFEEYLKNIFDPLFEVCLRFSQAELCVLCQKIKRGVSNSFEGELSFGGYFGVPSALRREETRTVIGKHVNA